MIRSTFHYQPHPPSDDELVAEIATLAQDHPRYGYRRGCGRCCDYTQGTLQDLQRAIEERAWA